jgi:uncharacterized membrane protein YhaH (DUF805 family)
MKTNFLKYILLNGRFNRIEYFTFQFSVAMLTMIYYLLFFLPTRNTIPIFLKNSVEVKNLIFQILIWLPIAVSFVYFFLISDIKRIRDLMDSDRKIYLIFWVLKTLPVIGWYYAIVFYFFPSGSLKKSKMEKKIKELLV